MDASILHRSGPSDPDLAYIRSEGADGNPLPTVLFCTGFRSDMTGIKAVYLERQCRLRGQAFVRFDYSGHGQSGGRFEDGTIGQWTRDALDVLDRLTDGRVIVVGSSMGGWIALNMALVRKDRVAGLVGVAAAPDFTRAMREALTPAQGETLRADGILRVPNHYSDEPYVITAALLEDGERHCLLDGTIDLDIPVRLVQGMADRDVPWQTAHRIRNAMAHPERTDVLLVEHGDHRLSQPENLALIDAQVAALSLTGV